MSAAPKFRMTYAEYLAGEEASGVKREYLRGDVWAMAGGTIEHGARRLLSPGQASVERY